MSLSPGSFLTHAHWQNRRRVGWALIIAAVIFATPAFFRWLRYDGEPNILTDPALNRGPSVSAQGMEITARNEKGQREWYIKARHIDISDDKRYATATDLERGIYFRDDKPYLYVTAKRVRFDQQTHDFHSPAEFTVKGPDGLVLKSRDARWNNALKILDCPQRVVATMKGNTIETSQVVYYANLSELRSKQPVNLKSDGISVKGSPGVADIKNQILRMGGVDMMIQPKAVERLMR